MNLQQLNQSGQRLSVFLTTAGVALAVTGISWFIIEQTNDYRAWRERDPDANPKSAPKYSITVRIAMLLWLMANGHTKWMRKTGVWLPLLRNTPSNCTNYSFDVKLPAGDFVSRYSHERHKNTGIFEDYRFRWRNK